MEDGEKLSLEQIRAFLEASEEVRFQAQDRGELYGWVERTLRQQNYAQLARQAKGLVRRYVAKMKGLSRAQSTRLIHTDQQGQEVKPRAYGRRRFPQRYTAADIELLAGVDAAHETLSGPATRKILQREFHDFSDQRFQRLAQLSVAQMYRLRQRREYRSKRVAYQHTHPGYAGGHRRAPQARSARLAWLPAPGHGASGRLRRREGPVPHQRCGRSDAMASGGSPPRTSRKPGWSLFYKPYWNRFRSTIAGFILATAASSSTTRCPS